MKKKKEEIKTEEVSELDAQLRLAEIMNDTPRTVKLGKRTFQLRALRYGTQHLIAEEAAKITKADESYADIIKRFAVNVPAVVRCITFALLNDKDKIYKGAENFNDGFGTEYHALYDYISWETDSRAWLPILMNTLEMLNLGFFFRCTSQIDLFRQMTLTKKITSETS